MDLWLWCVDVGSLVVNKCTILVSDTDNGGGHTCVGEKGYVKSVYFPQFCEIKTALKKLILLKKIMF